MHAFESRSFRGRTAARSMPCSACSGAAVDWALSRGADAIQSGQTGYAPKIETGHRLVPLTNYCAHRNRLRHPLGRALAPPINLATPDDELPQVLQAPPDL